MKYFLFVVFLFPVSVFSQQTFIKVDSFAFKENFIETVKTGMNKHHSHYRSSDFYKFNVVKTPIYESGDSIVYRMKFQTPGIYLWDALGTFTKSDNKIICELKDFKLVKKTSIREGITYMNVAVNEMEPTKGNKLNLYFLEKEIDRFFKIWD
jgi:hypothetical protein